MTDACWFHITQAWSYEKQSCIGLYYDSHGASRRLKSRKLQVESWDGELVDFQVVLVPSQVVNANPSDSQV